METDLRLFDEVLSKKWRTEVVDDKTFRLSAGDVMQGSVSELLICMRTYGWVYKTKDKEAGCG